MQQELMLPHREGPSPWQECKFNHWGCHVQQANHNQIKIVMQQSSSERQNQVSLLVVILTLLQ